MPTGTFTHAATGIALSEAITPMTTQFADVNKDVVSYYNIKKRKATDKIDLTDVVLSMVDNQKKPRTEDAHIEAASSSSGPALHGDMEVDWTSKDQKFQ